MSDLIYTPPGIYINEDASAVPNLGGAVALPPARVALVGPSIGYQTYTEPVQLNGTVGVELTQKGVDDDTIVVRSISGALYTGTDFEVTQVGDVVEEAVTSVARADTTAIADGETVYVTYRYTNSAFYLPYLSADWSEIQSRYGPAIDSATGQIGSPLTLAAKIVMEQGPREVILVPTKGSSPTSVTAQQLNDAYVALNARDDVSIVVPLPVGIFGDDGDPGDTTTAAVGLQQHVEQASEQGLFRIGVIGYDTGGNRTHATVAQSINSARVVLAYPNVVTWYNGYSNSTVEVGGCYLAAAYGGILAANQPQMPLTRRGVRSFSGIPPRVLSTMTATAKNAMSGAGVAVTEQLADGRLVIRHGLSTKTTNVLTREVSITRAKDSLIRMLRQVIDASGLIGSPMTANTPVEVRGVVEGGLVQAKNINLIVDYSNLSSRRGINDPTTIEVKFAYVPAYPLNKVNVSFAINVVTGSVEEV